MMGPVLALLLTAATADLVSAGGGSTLSLLAGDRPGSFSIAVNGVPWFSSGNVSVTAGGSTYSTADGSLKPKGAASAASGHDVLGAFTSQTQAWIAGATAYTTSSRIYAAGNFVIFEQTFPDGAKGTNITLTKGSSIVSSCFPSIDPQPSGGQDVGYVWWGGRAFLEGSQGGKWNGGDRRNGPGVGTGDGGGPFVVFGENMSDSLVFSPASNFMINTPGMSSRPGSHEPDAASTHTTSWAGAEAEVSALTRGSGGGGRGYELFAKSYCSHQNKESFKGEGFTVAQCRAKCDSMKCACFDISASDPKSECRCMQNAPPGGGANTTTSANGLEAFVFCGAPSCGGPAPPPVRHVCELSTSFGSADPKTGQSSTARRPRPRRLRRLQRVTALFALGWTHRWSLSLLDSVSNRLSSWEKVRNLCLLPHVELFSPL